MQLKWKELEAFSQISISAENSNEAVGYFRDLLLKNITVIEMSLCENKQ
jgi:hypothetical protein